MNRTLRDCVALLLALSGGSAMAIYRCGNVYQDGPCASGPEVRLSPSGRPAGGSAAPSAAPTAPGAAPPPPATSQFAAFCARVGDQAQRIAWKREGGATQEQQLAERATVLSPEEQGKTIVAVYARRGTAPEIRNAIQAECLAEKQKEAEAAEMLKYLRKQAGETGRAPTPSSAPAAAPEADAAQARPATASNKPSALHCDNLRKSVDHANSRLRQGGSASTMEYLHNQRRQAEEAVRSAGCG